MGQQKKSKHTGKHQRLKIISVARPTFPKNPTDVSQHFRDVSRGDKRFKLNET